MVPDEISRAISRYCLALEMNFSSAVEQPPPPALFVALPEWEGDDHDAVEELLEVERFEARLEVLVTRTTVRLVRSARA